MNYQRFYDTTREPRSGAVSGSEGKSATGWAQTEWRRLWTELVTTQLAREYFGTTTTFVNSMSVEAFPRASIALTMQPSDMLQAIEVVFGDSESDLARMLRVTRPMIYHYRQGMEPTEENKRRLCTLAEFASEWMPLISTSLQNVLKKKQPEGRSLLEFLSDSPLDIVALRLVVGRNVATHDQALRMRLAAELSRSESSAERQDIVRERHAAGKPVYIGDRESPGKLIQILPDGRRVRGRMVNRKFIPDRA